MLLLIVGLAHLEISHELLVAHVRELVESLGEGLLWVLVMLDDRLKVVGKVVLSIGNGSIFLEGLEFSRIDLPQHLEGLVAHWDHTVEDLAVVFVDASRSRSE